MGNMCKGGSGQPTGFGGSQSNIFLSEVRQLSMTQVTRSSGLRASQLTSSFLQDNTNALILGCKKGQNLSFLNRYMLTYMFFLKPQSADFVEFEIDDFTKILSVIDEDNAYTEEINQLRTTYKAKPTPRQKAQFLIGSYFKNGFFSSAIQKFPLSSIDPSVIGYIRRPLLDLSKGIKAKYQTSSKKKQIYCVIQTKSNQEALLQQMAKGQDYFTFSTFVRCFSNQQKARKRQKQLEELGKGVRESMGKNIKPFTIFFYIQIPKQEIDSDYDYGFYHDQTQKDNEFGDIIMNVMNFFQVTGSLPDSKEFTLKYNALSRLIHMKRARTLQTQPQLLKVVSLNKSIMDDINTHSQLLRVVTNNELSIRASQSLKKIASLKPQNKEDERINLIEAYIANKDYDSALSQCDDTLRFKVRKAQINYEAQRQAEVDRILEQIQPKKNELKDSVYFKEYILYEFISAKRKIAKGQKEKAKEQLQVLSDVMKKKYKGNYEIKGRQIEKDIASCRNTTFENKVQWEKYSDGLQVSVMLSY